MWIFLPGGLLMPSQTPMNEANPALTLGRREIQVRGRVVSHLEWFRDVYVAPFTDDYSDIELTPHMDYNCRFYMTHEEFAKALGRAVMDIDYRKFKPTAEGIDVRTGKPFIGGRTYHNVLNSIWGSVCRLGAPGGSWGPRSKDNPNGYRPAKSVKRGRGTARRGVSFRDSELEPELTGDDAPWYEALDAHAGQVDAVPDYKTS